MVSDGVGYTLPYFFVDSGSHSSTHSMVTLERRGSSGGFLLAATAASKNPPKKPAGLRLNVLFTRLGMVSDGVGYTLPYFFVDSGSHSSTHSMVTLERRGSSGGFLLAATAASKNRTPHTPI